MKKKLLSVLLCVSMVAAMAMGCGSKEATAPAADAAEESEDAEAPEEETEDTEEAADVESDLAYVKEKGTLVVGITDFEPMDFKDEDGEWVGFDAYMARLFAASLGVEVEYVEIDWDNKILELNGKSIDCVWNGMTLTADVMSAMECSNAYCNNAQIVVAPADVADQYQDVDSLAGLTFAVEAGSAGEEVLTALIEEEGLDISITPVQTQAAALLEIASRSSDAAVIDSLMAAAMVGEGTDYEDLTYTIGLNSEEYGVGFRKGSDLAAALNEFLKACYEDGTLQECAELFDVQAALIEQ